MKNKLTRVLTVLLPAALLLLAGCSLETRYDSNPKPLDAWMAQWDTAGYPDDVAGIYYDEEAGCLALLVVGESAVKTYEKLLTGAYTVGTAAYSMNEMLAAQAEIGPEMTGEDSKIYATGVGWTNIDGQVTGFGASGKEFRLVVSVDKSVLAQYTEAFHQRYGDMVYVEVGEPVVLE